ncbi:hypothetical protein M9Y10_012624 [Tritrichomonas musculus]|uniref:Uncharacterized protein n=1 Tax=Tritrichomonas musculus TaxID=1915356 RepID=A0ABR2IDT1_9EUKA
MNSQSSFQDEEEEEEEYEQGEINKIPDIKKNSQPEKNTSPKKKNNMQTNVTSKKRNDTKIEPSQSNLSNEIEIDQSLDQVPSDVSAQIAELKSMIDSRNQQFEAEFDELKRSHQAKLKMLKQSHITREQNKSNAFDLEYRNLIWTTTLKHLNRGCFTEDLRLLFQQAISDEQYRLEKEIIKLKQKNDEEIQNLRENLPKTQLRNRTKKTFVNLDIMDPVEMAQIIYNNCFPDPSVDNYYDYEIQMIDKMLRKIQRGSMLLSSFHLNSPKKPLKQKPENINYERREKQIVHKKRSPSPKPQQKDKYKLCIESHKEACQRLDKSVKETDKFIKNLQDKDWFNDIFPHVE